MIKNIPFGYEYDEKNKKIVVKRKQAMIVKRVFNLAAYGFNDNEIERILEGESIYNVIKEKICNIMLNAQEYNKRIGTEFISGDKIEIDIVNILKNRDDIENNVIKYLKNSKEMIKKIDSSMKEVLIDEIEHIINILNCLDEITKIISKK